MGYEATRWNLAAAGGGAFLKKFPYGVHFNIIENEIIIVAVFHTSQSPKKWSIR